MGSAIIKVVILLLVLSIANIGYAQNVFNVAFDVNSSPNISSNVLETQNGFIFTQRADYNGLSHIQAVKIDSIGNYVSLTNIKTSSNALFYGSAGSLQKLTNNEYCQLYKNGPDSSLRLVYFNENLTVVHSKELNLGKFTAPGLINQVNDSTILVLGQVINTGKWDLILVNTDLQGNERWRTIFGEAGKDDYGFSIDFVDNHIIIGSQTLVTNSIAHPHLYKFTTAGVLTFDTTYSEYNAGGYFFSHPNYGWYLSAAKKTASNYYPVLLKLNADFIINFSKAYFQTEKYVSVGFHSINDNGIITSAGLQIVDNVTTGIFFQTNHNGDSLGFKLINHIPGNLSQFHDIRPTSDGGYIMAGQTDAPTQDSWIVKVNAWGCDSLPCTVSVSELPKTDNGVLTCYPNPSNGMGTVKGSFNNANSTNEIKVFNSLGQLVFSKTIVTKEFEIEVNLPSSGLYLVNLYQGDLVVRSLKWVVQ